MYNKCPDAITLLSDADLADSENVPRRLVSTVPFAVAPS